MTNEQLEVTDEWLDRLVDGELCEEEYRRVLTALDAQPDGWRRCAAAFLEAQAWGRELRVVRHELVATPGAALATSNPRAKAAWLPLILAIAASFLVAFGLGIWWRGERVPRDVPLESIATAPEKEAAASSANLEAQLVPARPAPGESVPEEVVTLVVDRGDGAQEQFSLPVYDANDTISGCRCPANSNSGCDGPATKSKFSASGLRWICAMAGECYSLWISGRSLR